MNRKKKKLKPAEIWCPYCGRKAVLRSASYIYGENCIQPQKPVYVCSGYPEHCDAYVGAHEHNLKPMGTMANGELRHLRIEAHHALNAITNAGYMTKKGLYIWLANKMNLHEKDMHIAQFSFYRCGESIRICDELLAHLEKQNRKGGNDCRRTGNRKQSYAAAGIG